VSTTTHHPPALRAAGALGADLLFYALMWGGVGLALLTINLVANGVWGEVDGSVWDGSASLFQYAMLGGGIMVIAGYLPVYLTHGLTRRDVTTGALIALVGLAAVAALATTAGYGIERLVFAVADWPHVLVNEREMHIYDSPDQYGLIFVELFGLYATHAIAGMLIVAGLFRLGWLFGFVFALAGVGVALGAELALGSGAGGVLVRDWLDLDPPPVGVGLAVAAGLAVAGALLARMLLAGVTIETKDAALWR
jgi:hypothetical protein